MPGSREWTLDGHGVAAVLAANETLTRHRQ